MNALDERAESLRRIEELRTVSEQQLTALRAQRDESETSAKTAREELTRERDLAVQSKAALSGEMATLVETRTGQIEQLTAERQTALDERAESLRRIEELKTSSEQQLAALRNERNEFEKAAQTAQAELIRERDQAAQAKAGLSGEMATRSTQIERLTSERADALRELEEIKAVSEQRLAAVSRERAEFEKSAKAFRVELDHERGQAAQAKAVLSGEMATLVETRAAQIEQLTNERQAALDERAETLRRIEGRKADSERQFAALRTARSEFEKTAKAAQAELSREREQASQAKAALSGEMATLVETHTAQLTHERAESLRRIEELKTNSEGELVALRAERDDLGARERDAQGKIAGMARAVESGEREIAALTRQRGEIESERASTVDQLAKLAEAHKGQLESIAAERVALISERDKAVERSATISEVHQRNLDEHHKGRLALTFERDRAFAQFADLRTALENEISTVKMIVPPPSANSSRASRG